MSHLPGGDSSGVSHGHDPYTPIVGAARRVFEADLAAARAHCDRAVECANEAVLSGVHGLAAHASASASDIGLKLATLMRLRMVDVHFELSATEIAELTLLASALADCVILGDHRIIPPIADVAPRRGKVLGEKP